MQFDIAMERSDLAQGLEEQVVSLEREEDSGIDEAESPVRSTLAGDEKAGVDGVGKSLIVVVCAQQRTEVCDQFVGHRNHHLCLSQGFL